MKRLITGGALALVLSAGLSGCSATSTPAPPAAESAISDGTILLDVRTPTEFAEGRLSGAINIDVHAADFEEQLAALDPGAEYLVYCRSGNRSTQAIARMAELGFSQLTNGGSISEAAALAGAEVVSE